MWQIIGARAVGTSHTASGAPCQDREAFRVVDDADGGEVAIAVVCDGAGSARFSDAGAELVSEAFRGLAAAFASNEGVSNLTKAHVAQWLEDVRSRIVARAQAEAASARDYACTLVSVIATADQTVCAQVGDGAVVVNERDGWRVPLWPENGEYANQTFFVSQEDARDHLQFARFGPVSDFVVFSDGLQRLALDEALRAPHTAFFGPLVATVRSAEAVDATRDALEDFLRSERVNGKTDDDKSIVIGCRVE